MAVLSFILSRDHSLMRRINRWPAPRWVRMWMVCASLAGNGWLWYGIGVAVLLFGGEPRYRAVACATIAGFLSVAVFLSLKRLAGRKRPCHIEPHCWAQLLPPDRFSFPSGHTMVAFALCASLIEFYPGMLWSLAFSAVSIAASRVLLGMHFLSDVVAGAVLGLGIAYLVMVFWMWR